ncbi:hypothetical protein WG219_21355 [Ectopseudomonas mendocina]|uniref:Uncharacterized protein n=1 Tax=Ectopseudomonas mendocina TaxID=300 RepID=A0ABZ2RMA9_ECTME
MNSTEYIQDWCKSKKSFYYFLPIGSEGRPFDSQYKVLNVIGGDDLIVLVMSEGIKFTFFGKVQLRDEGMTLAFCGFEKMIYESGNEYRVYENGEFGLSGL